MRNDGRAHDELRLVKIETGFFPEAEGSALISLGNTVVACAASVESRVPPFLAGKGRGWVTGEYRMLPRSTNTRTPREGGSGGLSGRTQEIQRLIGRSLRMAVDMTALGEKTITIDCDVLRADGGTRTAAITGGYVALALATERLLKSGQIVRDPLIRAVAAVSMGVVAGEMVLDLPYAEDSRAEVDFNLVMTDALELVELQGSAEAKPFSESALKRLVELGKHGIRELLAAQSAALIQARQLG